MTKTSDFDYYLPQSLIAQEPSNARDHSRLMVLDRKNKSIEHKYFYEITDYINKGDLLVLNNTKVFPARLIGKKDKTNGVVEILLLNKIEPNIWQALVSPSKRIRKDTKIIFAKSSMTARSLKKINDEIHLIELSGEKDTSGEILKIGRTPLPPYITKYHSENTIKKKYQTVFASKTGATAAPTAGLHFTKYLLNKIKKSGVDIDYITLHTGYATFAPIRSDQIEDHRIHKEYYNIPTQTAVKLKSAKRVVAVGTTTMRALESGGGSNETKLYIYPGYKFKTVDAMVTNFHLPKSSLLVLVSAFAGYDFIKHAYEEAVKRKYRFFSFGDAMLIL